MNRLRRGGGHPARRLCVIGDRRGIGMSVVRVVLVASALSVASAAAAHAEEWRYLAQDGPVEVAVDVHSFSGPSTRRTVRSVLVPVGADDPFAYLVVNATIDCDARTITGVSMNAHDPQGSLLGRRDLPPETEPVKEADGTASLANASCEGVDLTGRAFASIGDFTAWAKAPPAAR